MADVHSSTVRSKNMRAIRGMNTKPEIKFRKLIHSSGFRFSVHPRHLSSKPDLFLRKYKSAVLIHGCFWHAHKCSNFKFPTTRKDFWHKKFSDNIDRDIKNLNGFLAENINVLIIWECAITGPRQLEKDILLGLFERWLNAGSRLASIDNYGLMLLNNISEYKSSTNYQGLDE